MPSKRQRGWKSQIANGRVFELRSKSKHYPPPCGLIINDTYAVRFMVGVDDSGVIGDGLYRRRHNPNIYVGGICLDDFTSKRIARRRPDLEKFDADDLALIRYGYGLDFDGNIHGCSMPSIPLTAVAEWTVFWTQPYDSGFPYFRPNEREKKTLTGAWHFAHHGGSRNLGYKYGHVVATRHTGARLACVRKIVLRYLPDLIETKVHVVRSTNSDGHVCTTAEYDSPCPPLGEGRTTIIETPHGSIISCTSRYPIAPQQGPARGPDGTRASNSEDASKAGPQ